MKINALFQMDQNINIETDTTVAFIKEAQRRGYETLCYSPTDLAIESDGVVTAVASTVTIQDDSLAYRETQKFVLSNADVVFVRQNPPFDLRYITATYILEHSGVLCINNAKEIRNCPEKILPLLFPQFIPPTLISESVQLIKDFFADHQNIVLKPLYSYAGNDVIRVNEKINIQSIAELMISKYQCPIIAQKFCENLTEDKRVLLLDGEPISAMTRRITAQNEIRTNLRFNSVVEKVSLNERDYEICRMIGPELKKRGLIFAGIDIMDGFLLEINVTSPTGLLNMNRLYNTSLETRCWDIFETKIRK